MSALTPTERSLIARSAALTRWSRVTSADARAQATQAARQAFDERWMREAKQKADALGATFASRAEHEASARRLRAAHYANLSRDMNRAKARKAGRA